MCKGIVVGMMKEELLNKVEQYNLMDVSFEFFWKNFKYYKEEDREEFETHFPEYKKERLQIPLNSISYRMTSWPKWDSDFDYIIISIDIEYDNKNIGYFDAYFSLDGEYVTDYFVTYPCDQRQYW